MKSRPVYAVILAAGEGKRMKSPTPKVLIDLLGLPLLGHPLAAARDLKPSSIILIGGKHLPAMRQAFGGEKGVVFARQSKPLGTAHAVRQAMPFLPKAGADFAILNGDCPLVRGASLAAALAHHRMVKADITAITADVADPSGLGRIVRDSTGRFLRIVEEKDAAPEVRALREINAGQYFVRAEALAKLLPKVGRNNAQREYYLTDLIHLAAGKASAFKLLDPDETRGVNRPSELLTARRLLKERILKELAEAGVLVSDPDLTYIEVGVNVAEGCVIHPFVVLRRGVTIAARCSVGPFAHLRAGTVLSESAAIGSFVEATRTHLGARTKAPHLSYLGDAEIGSDVNIGAGTITANFDGRTKRVTRIEEGASIGAGTIFVAPVSVGQRARTGAGAVLAKNRNVKPGDLVVGVPARTLGGSSTGSSKTKTLKSKARTPTKSKARTDKKPRKGS